MMSSHQPEQPRGAKPEQPRDGLSLPEMEPSPLTPDEEAKVKAGLGSTDELKGFTAN